MTGALLALSLLAISASISWAQTTQGLIGGRLIDSRTGDSIPAAHITYSSATTNAQGSAHIGRNGSYVFPLLSPGIYHIRVESAGYQPQEIYELDLPVSAQLRLDFYLRGSSDVFQQGKYLSVYLPGYRSVVTFYGPDLDTSRLGSFDPPKPALSALESTLSDVIDPAQVRDLPLAGRDVYTMLVTQPGVASDSGTARGLGLAVNGQRPTASNFLLDGLENNNYLITGPLTPIAPEAIQEYRVSTNNFSAEYGGSSGYLPPSAVTRAGGSRWHGLAYYYLKNDALNANDFQRNWRELPRIRLKESEPGVSVGGPLRANELFASASFEFLRLASRLDPEQFLFPSPAFIQSIPSTAIARRLLDQYKPPDEAAIARPDDLNRYLTLQRVDRLWRNGEQRLMGRVALARLERPGFIWSPYKDFTAPLTENATGLALSWIWSLRSNLINEARFGLSLADLRFDRPKPEVPSLSSFDGVSLPGSYSFYSYRNRSASGELTDNLTWIKGKHVFKAGGGFLARRLDGYLTAGRDPEYDFDNLQDFALDHPSRAYFSLTRVELSLAPAPRFDRVYRYNQFSAFAQDSFRVAPRLVLNYGVRYENFGTPRNTGAVQDGVVQLGDGATFVDRLKSAGLSYPGGGDRELYAADRQDWAARAGFSLDLGGGGRTLLRGAYGLFYDRPFDNLWQNLRNNNIALRSAAIPAGSIDYLQPLSQLLPSLGSLDSGTTFPKLTMYQPGMRTPYVHSYFFGLQRRVTDALVVEANALGSLGRKLIATDIVNRQFSNLPATVPNRFARYNAALPDISYRSNQGGSDYNALTVIARYRTRVAQFQVAYTWSHTIDNQSEPLAGDFFDLNFTGRSSQTAPGIAAFSRQFDSRADRGSSDFDQRHNLVGYAIWELPSRLLRGWKVSTLGALRSGSPYSVTVPVDSVVLSGQPILNNRADIVAGGAVDRPDQPGGRLLLDPNVFRKPLRGQLGNSGRNAFRGPGPPDLTVS